VLDQTFTATARRQAREIPDRAALITPARSWTYAELDAESNRVAQGLRALGIKTGDRVGCLTKHTADCLLLTFGAMKLGAVCAPFNWRLTAPELDHLFTQNEIRVLLTDPAFMPTLEKVNRTGVKLTLLTEDADSVASFAKWRRAYEPTDTGYEPAPDDTALQLSSSGTTGLPKSVELTHRNLLTLCHEGPAYVGLHGGHVQLNALPNYHIAGIGNVLIIFYISGTSVLYPEFDPAQMIAAIARHRVTHMFLVPAMILFMLQVPGIDKADFSTLQGITYGGSPISEKVLRDALKVFRCDFYQLYGLTETTGMITCLAAKDHDPDGPRAHLLRSAGQPANGASVRVVDVATGRDVEDGDVGEIWIRSIQNMKSYFRNPKATAEVFPLGRDEQGGWFRTGDAGYLRDGYVYIHDRVKDMVISGGENIYPAEVENALAAHPAVAEVAVFGVPDDTWGEAVKACVVLRRDIQASEADLIAFAQERLARFKCPKSIDFVESLPRNPTGKLLKRVLREKYWAGRDRRVG
jgi:acyl-CoA synthetase (AMP-forming)/AMP-acid ligase II